MRVGWNMQTKICRILGACGLAFNLTVAGQTAGGAAGGGGAAAGGTGGTAATVGPAAGTATAAPRTTTVAPRPPASGPRIGTPIPSGAPGQNVSGVAGQSVTTTPGQSVTTTAPAPATTTATGATLPGQNPAGTLPGGTVGLTTAGTATSAGTVSTPVPFTTLPANIQSSIVNQIPPGAQLGQILQETTPQGNVVYRAQISQNGIMSEIPLIPGTTAQNFTRSGTLTTAAQQSAGTSAGFLTATPVTFGTLPTAVQGALTTAGNGAALSGLTFTPGVNGNGGIYRGMANGRPVEVRVGPNGQILPDTSRLATTPTTSTNDLKIDDLPVAVREAIRTSMPFAEVTRIRRVDSASGDLFDITLRSDDRTSRMRLSENGTVVEENKDLALSVTNSTPVTATNIGPKLTFHTLPQTVRDAIGIRTDQKSIRSLFLTNINGKTSYVVDFMDKDALRHRLFVAKDGLVLNTITNLFGIKPTGQMVVVSDLPAPARAAIEQQAGNQVMRVDAATRGTTPIYVVTYLKNGETQQMVITGDGQPVDALGAPAATETGQQNK
jgi:hypothetical protein